LRHQLGLPRDRTVDLWALQDPPEREKPSQPLPNLVKLAIFGSPKKKLTLQEIYRALVDRFDWFKDHEADLSWKNSIRHNLSLNKVFKIAPRPITEPGKGSYWTLD
ncbi:winged helix DNA-binding domain-containing protein, partial [Athelia psychrophila]